MTIDRAARARRRRELRAAHGTASPQPPRRPPSVSTEIEGLFSPAGKHQLERKEWVAVAKEDERESGAGPLDLDSGVVHLHLQDE